MAVAQKTRLEDALTAAYRRYKRELTTNALYKVRDSATCEDLVQDTFMKTWMYMVRGGKIEQMRAFLYHVLNHLIVDEYRRHRSVSLDALVDKGYEPSEDQTEQLFDQIDGKAVTVSICRLPKKYQRILRMRYVRGLSLEEMAAHSRQSRNTVAVQAHRGLERLKQLYDTLPKALQSSAPRALS